MDEAAWLACWDSSPMLEFLSGRASERKLRLFSAACFRRLWGTLRTERGRRAIEVLEEMADGLADGQKMRETFLPEVNNFACSDGDCNLGGYCLGEGSLIALNACTITRAHVRCAEQACILRDLFGVLPFRVFALNPALRTPAVLALAQAAYDHRTLPAGHLEPERLAILADALEEAGSTVAELLSHLRGLGPHVRGCWSVDLLLKKT
jgi:hypothetical protein